MKRYPSSRERSLALTPDIAAAKRRALSESGTKAHTNVASSQKATSAASTKTSSRSLASNGPSHPLSELAVALRSGTSSDSASLQLTLLCVLASYLLDAMQNSNHVAFKLESAGQLAIRLGVPETEAKAIVQQLYDFFDAQQPAWARRFMG